MDKIQKNITGSIIFIILGITIWLLIPIYVPEDTVTVMGASFFPRFISIAMIVFSTILLVTSIIQLKKGAFIKEDIPGKKQEKVSNRDRFNGIGIFIISVLYMLMINRIGFLISTYIAVTSMLILFRERKIINYVIVYSIILIVYYVFTHLLLVQFP
ncbi:MAG: tripartite tricarboxylate transporter TctB family protein [Firmicutes bacterium]|nr:tripartite tricarboxylate transporter TctB family protein [Bacillota bacterium]